MTRRFSPEELSEFESGSESEPGTKPGPESGETDW